MVRSEVDTVTSRQILVVSGVKSFETDLVFDRQQCRCQIMWNLYNKVPCGRVSVVHRTGSRILRNYLDFPSNKLHISPQLRVRCCRLSNNHRDFDKCVNTSDTHFFLKGRFTVVVIAAQVSLPFQG